MSRVARGRPARVNVCEVRADVVDADHLRRVGAQFVVSGDDHDARPVFDGQLPGEQGPQAVAYDFAPARVRAGRDALFQGFGPASRKRD